MSNIQDDLYSDCDHSDAFYGSVDDAIDCSADQYGELSKRESAATERQYFAIGYHETYENSHEASLQNGFDDGYCSSYDTAVRLGQTLGRFAVRVESSKKSRLDLSQETNETTATENKLTEISHRVRGLLLSLTKAKPSRDKENSKDDHLQTTYDGINAGFAQSSTNVLQQQRLQEQNDLEDLIEIVENITNIKATD